MIIKLLEFQWKDMTRSNASGQQITRGIVFLIISIFVFIYGIGIGFLSGWLLRRTRSNVDLVAAFTCYFMLGLVLFLLLRFLAAGDPKLAIQKYLTLNIPTSDIKRFLIFKYFFHPYNGFLYGVIFSFFFFYLIHNLSVVGSILWLSILLCAITSVNFISYFLSSTLATNRLIVYPIIVVLIGFLFCQYKGYVDVLPTLIQVYDLGFVTFICLVLSLLLTLCCYYLVLYGMRSLMYLDNKDNDVWSGISFSTLERYGTVGYWMQLELKLLTRNSQGRRLLFLSFVFVAYAVFILFTIEFDFGFIFYGIMISSGFFLHYGSLPFSLNSQHFDFVIARSPSIQTYLKAKYGICALSCIILTCLSMPTYFINPKLVWFTLTISLFNIGIFLPVSLWVSVSTNVRLELNAPVVNSVQSFALDKVLLLLLILLFPMLIYGICYYFEIIQMVNVILALLGLLGLFFSIFLFQHFVSIFNTRKYSLRKRLVL